MKPQKAPQPPTYLEKFRQLRRVMDEIDPERYVQSVYGQKTDCGTFMCIAGHAAHDVWFRSQGWEPVWSGTGNRRSMCILINGLELSEFDSDDEFFGQRMSFLFGLPVINGPSSLDEAKARCNATIAELELEEVMV